MGLLLPKRSITARVEADAAGLPSQILSCRSGKFSTPFRSYDARESRATINQG
jgi:hypothetical protein